MRNSNLWMKKRFVAVQENVFADYMKMLHDERKNVEVEIQSSDHTVKLRVWILTLAPRSYYILMSAESTHIPPDNEIYFIRGRLSFHIVLFCVNISVQHEEMHFFFLRMCRNTTTKKAECRLICRWVMIFLVCAVSENSEKCTITISHCNHQSKNPKISNLQS